MLHFFGTEGHFRTHWENVRKALNGKWVSKAELQDPHYRDVPVFVASYGDLKKASPYRSHIIMAEHGVGLSYNNNHPSFVGGTAYKENVALRLVPNSFAKGKEQKYNPHMRIEVVGVPRMDTWSRIPYRGNPSRPLVVISTHWDCQASPETRSSFEYFKQAIADAAFYHNIALHAHPRAATKVALFARANKIPFIRDFDEVLEHAALYVTDNSSTLFEFAGTGRPVLVLNDPRYRRDIHHEYNPRFWSRADIGLQVDTPEQLAPRIQQALADGPKQQERRKEIVREVLPFLGRSEKRVISVLRAYMANPHGPDPRQADKGTHYEPAQQGS